MPKDRYYQGKKDKMDESRGMKKSMGKGNDYRNEDSEMIREDRNATANLPQEVIMKPYPRSSYGYEVGLDDTARVIDRQIMDDSKELKKDSYPEKY